MDRSEYQKKLEEINALVSVEDYEGALSVVESIDWRKVKSVRSLCMAADIYEINDMMERSKEVLLLAHKRSSVGKIILYRLVEVSLKRGELDEAVDFYEEFIKIAPGDSSRYILQYRIYKAKGYSIKDQIKVLEEYKNLEYTERWAYELAVLYRKAGMKDKCIEECDDLILWFSEGSYVAKAMELKMKYTELSDDQQEKYDNWEEETEDLDIRDELGDQIVSVTEDALRKLETADAEREKQEMESQKAMEEAVIPLGDLAVAEEQEEISNPAGSEESSPQEDEEDGKAGKDGEDALKAAEEHEILPMEAEELKEKFATSIRDVFSGITRGKEEVRAAYESRADQENQEPDNLLTYDSVEDLEPESYQALGLVHTHDLGKVWKESEEETGEKEEKTDSEDELIRKMLEETADTMAAEEIVKKRDTEAEDAIVEMIEGIAASVPDMTKVEEDHVDEEISEEELTLAEEEFYGENTEADKQELPEEVERGEAELEKTEAEAEETEAEETEAETEKTETEEAEEETEKAETEEAEAEAEEIETEEAEEETEKAETEEAEAEAEETKTEKTEAEVEKVETEETEAKNSGNFLARIKAVLAGIFHKKHEEPAEEIVDEAEAEQSELKEEKAQDDIGAETAAQNSAEEANGSGEELKELTEEAEAESMILSSEPEEARDAEENERKEQPIESPASGNTIQFEGKLVAMLAMAADEVFGEGEDQAGKAEEESEGESVPEKLGEDLGSMEEAPEKTAMELPLKEEGLPADEAAERVEEGENQDPHGETKEAPTKEILKLQENRVQKLSDEQLKVFTYFSYIPGMKEQVVDALNAVYRRTGDKTSSRGNLAVMGSEGSGKSRLSDNLVKAISLDLGLEAVKVARISGKDFNEKDPKKVVEILSGGFLILENASEMSGETIAKLTEALSGETDRLILLIEDNKKEMRKLLGENIAFGEKFDAVISIPVFTNDELVTFAKTYANEAGYKIDTMAVLALYTAISERQSESRPMTVARVKELVDKAMLRAHRGKMTRKVSGKRMESDGRILLIEKDFL